MVIVNDGGDTGAVESALALHRKLFGSRLTLIHNSESRGRAAAANAGVSGSSSEFIVLHDDDDTWHPDFLGETVTFLRRPENSIYGAVTTFSKIIKERILNDRVVKVDEEDFNSWQNHVSLYRLLAGDTIPVNSCLFRRAILSKVGLFNESLPVHADWEFLIRLNLQYEIGVVRRCLAFYHLRANSRGTSYGNSVVDSVHLYRDYDQMIRNEALRNALLGNEQALGILLNQNVQTLQLEQLYKWMERGTRPARLLRRYARAIKRMIFPFVNRKDEFPFTL
jgi:glycosyltransferase involved in cell wall biosynthesis